MNNHHIDNRFKVEKTLGEGGMGTVYLVKDMTKNNSIYALKTIKAAFLSIDTENTLQRFKIEYDIMTRLRHPNLDRVYDFGQDISGDYYIVMEYAEGISLREFLKQKTKLTTDLALPVMISLLRAFEFIHSRNIIYRDLKPENIIIKPENNLITNVKLLDFGLADLGNADNTTIKGTIHYMAPEVVAKQEVDYRADIFSLGILFYELITGSFIYADGSVKTALDHLLNEDKFILSTKLCFNEITPKELKPIIAKMTDFHKENRYRSCSEIIDDINKLLNQKFALETNETEQAYVLGVNFVSREHEMNILREASSDDTKELIVISGSIGIGKSRLTEEFCKYCNLNDILIYSGCSDNSLAYEPFLEIVNKILLHTDENDLPEMSGYLKLFYPFHPNLNNFLLPKNFDPNTTKGVLIQVISNIIISYSKKQKNRVVLIFNSFHNIDEVSLEIIENIINKTKNDEKTNKLLILAEIREEEQSKIDLFLSKQKENQSLTMLALKPFDSKEVESYIIQMFGSNRIHHSIIENIDKIRETVGGNPLFLQELLKLLVSNHSIIRSKSNWMLQKQIEKIEIPQTVKGIIHQRLKLLNLNKTDQKAFKILAVLYKSSFTIDFMNSLTKGLLDLDWGVFLNYLVENEIAYEKDKAYFPTSKLIGEIVREDISADEHIEFNRVFAAKLEEIYQVSGENTDKLSDEELFEITYHFVNSHYNMDNGLIEKTFPYLIASAKRCTQRFIYKKAINYYNTILEISNVLDTDDEKIVKIILNAISNKGSLLVTKNNLKDAEKILLEGLNRYENSNIKIDIANIKSTLARIYSYQSQYEKAMEYNLESKKIEN